MRPEVVIRQAPQKDEPRSWADARGALAQVLESQRVRGRQGRGVVRPSVVGVLEMPVDLRPRLARPTVTPEPIPPNPSGVDAVPNGPGGHGWTVLKRGAR